MSKLEFVFERPLFLLLAIPAFLVILLPFFRLSAQRRKGFRKIAPVALHLVAVTLLLLVLAGFSVANSTPEKAVMLLVDLSDSTQTVQKEIQGRAAQLMELMDKKTPAGVVVFGQDQIYTTQLSKDHTFSTAKVDSTATDISAALEYTASLLPTDRSGQIIVLSDGKQTSGDATDTAMRLAAQGIQIDAVYFDTTALDSDEVQLSSLQASSNVYKGDTIAFTAQIQSNIDTEVRLTLLDNSKLVRRETPKITAGTNTIELSCPAEAVGTHSYQLILESSKDTLEQNNECFAYVNVVGEPSVLILADTLSNAKGLALLLGEEFSVKPASVWDAPRTIVELCNYDAVVLSNANMSMLPQDYDQLLKAYVEVYGRTLLTVGGESTLMYGGMQGTAMEEILPVTLARQKDSDADAVALMLVLDCSGSMVQNGRNYLTLAKQGAIKCVKAMSGNDYVGLITFNSVAQVQSPLVRATENNKTHLAKTISGLGTGDYTFYRQALAFANDALLNCDAKTRHIMFLSDGHPSDRDYMDEVKRAAENDITVSTISIGFSSWGLNAMAETGNGRYYNVKDPTQLPTIMLSETTQVAVDSLTLGDFTPVISRKSQLTEGLGTTRLPMLHGYLATTIKDDAHTYIATEEGHPIYAQWNYGKGVVGCFTSDLSGKWSYDWVSNRTGVAVTRNMLSTTIDQLRGSSSMSAQVTGRGNTAEISVTTAGTEDSQVSLMVELAGRVTTYELTQKEPGIYTATFDTAKPGIYELLVTQADKDGNPLDYWDTAFTVSYLGEYDVFAAEGRTLLTTLCGYTGGKLYTNMQELAGVQVGSVQNAYDPMAVFALLVSLIMLADIGIRKLRWKDVRNFFLSRKAK